MKLTKKKVRHFIKEEKKAAKEYHPYRSLRELEKDEKHHKKVLQRRL